MHISFVNINADRADSSFERTLCRVACGEPLVEQRLSVGPPKANPDWMSAAPRKHRREKDILQIEEKSLFLTSYKRLKIQFRAPSSFLHKLLEVNKTLFRSGSRKKEGAFIKVRGDMTAEISSSASSLDKHVAPLFLTKAFTQ